MQNAITEDGRTIRRAAADWHRCVDAADGEGAKKAFGEICDVLEAGLMEPAAAQAYATELLDAKVEP